mmetsp:Transcript_35382/g.50194  ORF Transcript_35382/g.50194 Transcript_35382/m.50194 type:complete len:161 (-) Transcript_35382:890-1372(-)
MIFAVTSVTFSPTLRAVVRIVFLKEVKEASNSSGDPAILVAIQSTRLPALSPTVDAICPICFSQRCNCCPQLNRVPCIEETTDPTAAIAYDDISCGIFVQRDIVLEHTSPIDRADAPMKEFETIPTNEFQICIKVSVNIPPVRPIDVRAAVIKTEGRLTT